MGVILAIHNAFRRDIARIDTEALETARGKPGLAPELERFRFFNEILTRHARGVDALAFVPTADAIAIRVEDLLPVLGSPDHREGPQTEAVLHDFEDWRNPSVRNRIVLRLIAALERYVTRR